MLCHYHAFWYKFDGYWTYTQIPANRSSYQQRNVLKQQGKKSKGGGRERGKGSRTTILSLVFPPNLLSWRSKINPNSISSLISSSYTLVSSLATTFASAILQEADISQKMESREILYCLCLQLVCYLSHFNTILYQTSMGSGEPSSVSTYELKNSSSCLLLPWHGVMGSIPLALLSMNALLGASLK